jgi:hypothetical protein
MAQYQWVIQARNGTPYGELENLTSRGFSIPINRPPEARGTIRPDDASPARQIIRKGGDSELVIYRDGTPIESVFQLTNVAPAGDESGERIELGWLGILSYLQLGTAYAATSYATTAQSRIAWGLINTFQARTGASAYGITDFGAPTTDPTKSVTFEQDTDILDAIIALSERSSGFDFGIDAGRRFRCYYPQRGEDKSGLLTLQYGVNVDTYQFVWDTSPGQIGTDFRIVGAETTAVFTATDATAQAQYGRREISVQVSDSISETTNLQEWVDNAIVERDHPQAIPRVRLSRDHLSLPWGSYWVGDTVTLSIPSADIYGKFRIVQLHCDLDENDNETIHLDLNEA